MNVVALYNTLISNVYFLDYEIVLYVLVNHVCGNATSLSK